MILDLTMDTYTLLTVFILFLLANIKILQFFMNFLNVGNIVFVFRVPVRPSLATLLQQSSAAWSAIFSPATHMCSAFGQKRAWASGRRACGRRRCRSFRRPSLPCKLCQQKCAKVLLPYRYDLGRTTSAKWMVQ